MNVHDYNKLLNDTRGLNPYFVEKSEMYYRLTNIFGQPKLKERPMFYYLEWFDSQPIWTHSQLLINGVVKINWYLPWRQGKRSWEKHGHVERITEPDLRILRYFKKSVNNNLHEQKVENGDYFRILRNIASSTNTMM